jgi:hypothetical protein
MVGTASTGAVGTFPVVTFLAWKPFQNRNDELRQMLKSGVTVRLQASVFQRVRMVPFVQLRAIVVPANHSK